MQRPRCPAAVHAHHNPDGHSPPGPHSIGATAAPSAKITGAMRIHSRRDFLMSASAATLAAAATKSFAGFSASDRVFVASGTPEGIRSFDWNSRNGELDDAGIGAEISTVDWICFSPDRKYIFAACEVDSFNGKPTGEL